MLLRVNRKPNIGLFSAFRHVEIHLSPRELKPGGISSRREAKYKRYTCIILSITPEERFGNLNRTGGFNSSMIMSDRRFRKILSHFRTAPDTVVVSVQAGGSYAAWAKRTSDNDLEIYPVLTGLEEARHFPDARYSKIFKSLSRSRASAE